MKIKPADGRKVRDPHTKQHLPDDGREVLESTYWLRRIRSGDVVLVIDPVVQDIQIPDSTSDVKGEA